MSDKEDDIKNQRLDDDDDKIKTGFDRGIDYIKIKDALIQKLDKLYEKFNFTHDKKELRVIMNQICYIIIALLQLRNGCRISEAVCAFNKYLNGEDIEKKVVVKIAKSDGKKYNYKLKKMIDNKARYRKIMFPSDYVDLEIFYNVKNEQPEVLYIKTDRICQRVRDYLLKYFNCNTHSLRYAFINYMLYDMKRNLADIAKFVGHKSVNQLVTYTQHKNCDKIFDLKI